MNASLEFILALVLFLVGLRLSAFFSGSETGFYRVSFSRLTIDANSGDGFAKRLLWFSRNPSYFVATTLVGNNVANYITTLAIGLGISAILPGEVGVMEILATLALSPLIFIFGELVPKYLYFRAPLMLLRKDSKWFRGFYYLFFPISFPLVGITKIIERIGQKKDQPIESVLGRNRLNQMFSQGHREGILTDVQSRMINGLMHTASQSVRESITPTARILGISDDADRETVLEHARRYGLSHVSIKRAGTVADWFGYLRIADVYISREPLESLIRPLSRIPSQSSKLEALLILRNADELYGVVTQYETVIGLISERGLVEQLFRHSPTAGNSPVSKTVSGANSE